MVPMSSNLSSLFFVSETCKQHSGEDKLCVRQAIGPCCLFVSETRKLYSREDKLCLRQAICPRFFLFLKYVNNNTAGRTGCASVKQPVLLAFVFLKHVNNIAVRTSCAYVKQLILVAFLFPKPLNNNTAGRTGGAYVKQLVFFLPRSQ